MSKDKSKNEHGEHRDIMENKDAKEVCTHPLDMRYFNKNGDKCLKCGKILDAN